MSDEWLRLWAEDCLMEAGRFHYSPEQMANVASGVLALLSPADDAAPVTAGWLESMGFQVKGGWWQLRCGDYEVYCYTSPSRPSGFVFKYESHDCLDDGDGSVILPDLPTRGDVRRLLAGLKIATTEAV